MITATAAGAAGVVIGPVQAAHADLIGIGDSHVQSGNTAIVHGAQQSTNTTSIGSGVLGGTALVLPANTTQAAAGNSGITCEGGAGGAGGGVGSTGAGFSFGAM
ncbi:hypothetical protein ABZ595_19595 [Streptomyces rubradiris]|uniref:hypothetical protein n=1 Tax=Streptomyces rubradiris TaxID=285531 RepID=UPI0033F5D895